MARFEGHCQACGAPWEGQTQPGRADTCERCDADLHVCLNCRHHNPVRPNECEVAEAERVEYRDRANFCEYFEFRTGAPAKGPSSQDQARDRFDKLFGG